jgi:hypothetical protein
MAVDDGARGDDARAGLGCQAEGFGRVGDAVDLVERERGAVKSDHDGGVRRRLAARLRVSF